ncbi:MAG TPA: M28 family peptidase [Candidatus Bathyarchaeia archaeon]|nr:M28 family peptidase [Candidatus Bathyarchaeia archaeon]
MENPYADVDRRIVSEVYTSSETLDNLKVLCDVYGSRFPGTPGDLAAVKYMVDKLKSYGIENARYESFTLPGWRRGPAKLTALGSSGRELECISLPHSIAGRVEGKLVWLNDGPIESYEKRRNEIDGNIVMVSSANPIGMDRPLHRSEKFLRSVLAGAKGWIFMNQYPGYGPQTGGVSPVIPSVGVSYEDGMFLVRTLEREDEVSLRIETTDRNMEVTTYNVIADIQGTSDSRQHVVVGSHYDGHDISQGAEDPASGTVVVMEIARNLQAVKDRMKRHVRCICFGAEEIGLYGSHNYVIMHKNEMDDVRFMLNLDSGGNKGKKGVILHNFPELETFIAKAASEMKAELPTFQRVSPYSDHWPFFLKSVPSGYGGDPEMIRTSTGRGFGHSKFDTVDKVELEQLRLASANYTRLLFRIANAEDWRPRRKSEDEIQEFIKKQGYDQTVQLADKVKEYVRTWKQIHPETKEWLNRRSEW